MRKAGASSKALTVREELTMQSNLQERGVQERSVFQPRELEILKIALQCATLQLEEQYGSLGPKAQQLKLISATAMFELARSGNMKTEDLINAAAESVRVFLTWACEA
jgi:hypothetical protein